MAEAECQQHRTQREALHAQVLTQTQPRADGQDGTADSDTSDGVRLRRAVADLQGQARCTGMGGAWGGGGGWVVLDSRLHLRPPTSQVVAASSASSASAARCTQLQAELGGARSVIAQLQDQLQQAQAQLSQRARKQPKLPSPLFRARMGLNSGAGPTGARTFAANGSLASPPPHPPPPRTSGTPPPPPPPRTAAFGYVDDDAPRHVDDAAPHSPPKSSNGSHERRAADADAADVPATKAALRWQARLLASQLSEMLWITRHQIEISRGEIASAPPAERAPGGDEQEL